MPARFVFEPRARAPRLVSGAASGVEEPAPLADECEQQPGTPPPEPLERSYAGVAARARCQGELRTIVSGVSHSLGAVRVLPLGSRLSRDDAPKTDRQLDFAIE